MKNKSVILGIIIIVVVSLLTTGCAIKSALSVQEFKDHMGALGYSTTEDEKALYEAKSYLVASKSDVPYKIEFYEFEEKVEAQKVFKKYTDNIADYLTTSSKNIKTTGALFDKFVAKSDNEYIVVDRVKNTLIFIAGTVDYQEEIDSLLEDINY